MTADGVELRLRGHRDESKDDEYCEDVLIEKMQEGQYGWLDYVNHHSRESHGDEMVVL